MSAGHIISAGAGGLMGWTIANEMSNFNFFSILDAFITMPKNEFLTNCQSFGGSNYDTLKNKLTLYNQAEAASQISSKSVIEYLEVSQPDPLTKSVSDIITSYISELISDSRIATPRPKFKNTIATLKSNLVNTASCSSITGPISTNLNNITSDLAIKTNEVKRQTADISKLQNDINGLNKMNADIAANLTKANNEITELKKSNQDITNDLNNIRAERNELRSTLSARIAELERLSATNKTLQDRNENLINEAKLNANFQLSSNILNVMGTIAAFAISENIESLKNIDGTNYKTYINTTTQRETILNEVLALYLPAKSKEFIVKKQFEINNLVNEGTNADVFFRLLYSHINILRLKSFR